MEVIGFLAAFLTTIAFLPQVYKIYKSNKTDDLSLLTFSLFTIGVFCWLSYGIYIKNHPVILANAITFLLALYILIKIILNLKRH
ncbi:SemiSWEET family sugar transporter [Arcobacter sp.]|uniref:SemiSWEET family sugar transporter n=1 Tax=Arcobacter sp. TaxID=1872629 RepID=UPI003D0F07A7